ncbi:hypothetical protein EGW08_013797 [Elysia chlorotica]|uniref:Serine protease n=1 Tax=Elysia chlorotica TaxID=188477 RepID=A0A433TA01_ELYCH|nr:hypothetical protein EGW08_013797 [Elysia chlorotica]
MHPAKQIYIAKEHEYGHECELLGRGSEAAESEARWKECKKNPGHEDFISIPDFTGRCFPKLQAQKHRDRLGAAIDLTTRLRVKWTSPLRPDEDPFSDVRGSDKLRLGSGFIVDVGNAVLKKPNPFGGCVGKKAKKSWRITVQTAHHVVFDTAEAKKTKVDLFYDYDSCRSDGTMRTLAGLEVLECDADKDVCSFLCVIHDEALGKRIESSWRCWWAGLHDPLDLSGLDLLCCVWGGYPIMIVSHPHGKPKRITVDEGREEKPPLVEYNAATCPGSSGAPVFRFVSNVDDLRRHQRYIPVHIGNCSTSGIDHQQQNFLISIRRPQKLMGRRKTKLDQLNYGNKWWCYVNT